MADDFFTFLVDETLKLQNCSEKQLFSLEQKLSDYHLHYLKGLFLPQIKMIRFRTDFGDFDVPKEWSSFKAEYALIDQDNDGDQFLRVMKHAWNASIEKILILHEGSLCYLVGFNPGEDSCLQALLSRQELHTAV